MSYAPRIIVVEHDHDTLEVVGEVLQFEGYDSILCHHAILKPKEVEVLHTDVIILDWSCYNKVEVFQFVEEIAAYPPTSTIPIIIYTTASKEQMRPYNAWLISRGIHVLYKPEGIDELIPTITRYADKSLVS